MFYTDTCCSTDTSEYSYTDTCMILISTDTNTDTGICFNTDNGICFNSGNCCDTNTDTNTLMKLI